MAFEFFPMTDYAKEETERVLRELPTLETGDFRFAFMPDYHYKYIREMRTSFSNIIHMLNALNENEKIEFFCLGGDNVGNYPPSKEEHIDMMADLAMYFPYSNVPVIAVQGNHDDNSIHSKIAPDSEICRTETIVPNDVQYDKLFAQHEKIENFHVAHEKALYGYLDIPSADARVIFLDSTDVPFILDGDVLRYNQQWNFGFTGRQLTWLANTALQNAPKNVVFIAHVPFNNEERDFSEKEAPRYNYEALDAISKAFRDGESIHITSDHPDFGYDISADFTEKHNVIARIGGHIHIDSECIDTNGFLDITSMLGGRKSSGLIPNIDGTIFEREPFSKNETAVDIFTVSPARGKIFITRYGSGNSREIDM